MYAFWKSLLNVGGAGRGDGGIDGFARLQAHVEDMVPDALSDAGVFQTRVRAGRSVGKGPTAHVVHSWQSHPAQHTHTQGLGVEVQDGKRGALWRAVLFPQSYLELLYARKEARVFAMLDSNMKPMTAGATLCVNDIVAVKATDDLLGVSICGPVVDGMLDLGGEVYYTVEKHNWAFAAGARARPFRDDGLVVSACINAYSDCKLGFSAQLSPPAPKDISDVRIGGLFEYNLGTYASKLWLGARALVGRDGGHVYARVDPREQVVAVGYAFEPTAGSAVLVSVHGDVRKRDVSVALALSIDELLN